MCVCCRVAVSVIINHFENNPERIGICRARWKVHACLPALNDIVWPRFSFESFPAIYNVQPSLMFSEVLEFFAFFQKFCTLRHVTENDLNTDNTSNLSHMLDYDHNKLRKMHTLCLTEFKRFFVTINTLG